MATASIPPLKKRPRSVSIELAAHFERLIATGQIEAGSRLPSERELAATMSVSRTSLREAMHELEAKNLITRRPGWGTVVLEQSAEVNDLDELKDFGLKAKHVMELREALEPQIAGLAALRATPASLLQIRDVLDSARDAHSSDDARTADAEFHLLLSQAAQNPLFTRLGTLSSQWMTDVRKSMKVSEDAWSDSMHEHEQIYEAMENHDHDSAVAAMKVHLANVQHRLRAQVVAAHEQ